MSILSRFSASISREGVLFVISIYILCITGHILLPASVIEGYVCNHQGNILSYRLNGMLVYFAILLLYFQLPLHVQLIPYTHYFTVILTCHTIGILTSLYFFLTSKCEKYAICMTRNHLDREGKVMFEPPLAPPSFIKYSFSAFYTGREWNPRIFNVDIKVLLYLIGAILLQINIFASALYQKYHDGHLTHAMIVYNVCFTWFIVEYLIGERVHLYTYDFFAEKVGMKFCWGCLTFYPCFYCIGVFPLVDHIPLRDISLEMSIFVLLLYFLGWCITRGANMQKYYHRTNPQQKYVIFGLIQQEKSPDTRILVSGFWGIARHFNYFGEIMQSIAVSIPGVVVGAGWLRLIPLLYPLYYLLLFVPRQLDDDFICKQKYGEAWDAYVEKVPWRICPGIW